MKILIVEDENLIAMHLEQLVGDIGHQVCAVASTEAEAITSAGTHRPDLVLMDLHLAQGGSGAEAARQIYKHYGIRSIFLSGNIDESMHEALQGCDPVAFLGKPFLPIDLHRALKNYHPLSCVRVDGVEGRLP